MTLTNDTPIPKLTLCIRTTLACVLVACVLTGSAQAMMPAKQPATPTHATQPGSETPANQSVTAANGFSIQFVPNTNNGQQITFIAIVNRQRVGSISAHFHSEELKRKSAISYIQTGWYIAHLAVMPEHQRHGIASALIQHVIERIGNTNAYLIVGEDNVTAIRLYERVGFTDRQKYADLENGIVMRRPAISPTQARL